METITYGRFFVECQRLADTRNVEGISRIRMGQFFCNKFPWLIDLEPTLFYEEDEKKAKEIIFKYVTY